jgi:hypothetical protein
MGAVAAVLSSAIGVRHARADVAVSEQHGITVSSLGVKVHFIHLRNKLKFIICFIDESALYID